MKQRDFTSARTKEALLPDKEEKYCGECCWFYAEDTDGYGCCPFQFGEVVACDRSCKSPDDFVGKEEMRHHMAVLLQTNRFFTRVTPTNFIICPSLIERINAWNFAYKYMKVFSKL